MSPYGFCINSVIRRLDCDSFFFILVTHFETVDMVADETKTWQYTKTSILIIGMMFLGVYLGSFIQESFTLGFMGMMIGAGISVQPYL